LVLDPVQLARIEATHSGFLYQHLFAVAQLLLGGEDADALLVESDEDVEIRKKTEHVYVQVKNLKDVLQPNDVQPILERFELLRAEHQSQRRHGSAAFAVVSRSETSPSLSARMTSAGWPADVVIATPGNRRTVSGVPAWASISDAIEWTATAATQVPFSRLAPQTLVWKMAAHVQMVATGKLYGGSHEIQFEELPQLREQLNLFADVVPPPPSKYRPQLGEPRIDIAARIRVIVGVSGAGKTSWLSSSAEHLSTSVVFMRASSEIVDVASWLVRNLAATLLRSNNDTISAVFRPGAVGSESLRLLDHVAARTPITIAIDNAHLLDAGVLARCVNDSARLRWIVLMQPGPQTASLLARLQLDAEQLGGWAPTTIASVLADFAIPCSPELALRLRAVTAGSPLFIEGAARVAREHYAGDIGRLLDEQSRGTHVARLPQEQIVADDVVRYLTADAKLVGGMLAQLRSDIPIDLVRRLATEALRLPAPGVSLRELTEWHILRPGAADTVAVHDAFRPALNTERALVDPAVRSRCMRFLLDEINNLRGSDSWSLERLLDTLRLLTDLGEAHAVVDAVYGGIEWLREYGAGAEVALLLAEAVAKPELSDEFKFLGADTLAYLAAQNGDPEGTFKWIAVCEDIAKRPLLAVPDWESRLAIKRIIYFGITHDYPAAQEAFAEYEARWADRGTEGYRVVRYDLATAAHSANEPEETIRITSQLIAEYFELLALSPQKLFAKNIPDLLKEVAVLGNEDEIRHLADCLHLRATVTIESGGLSGLDSPWAMKLYTIVHALASALQAGLEWANSMIRYGDITTALSIFEDHVVPILEHERLMGWLVPVYVGYARALVAGGRLRDALARLDAIEVFAPSFSLEDRQLFDRVELKVRDAERRLGADLVTVPAGIRRIDRQHYDSYKPIRLLGPWQHHEELAWFEMEDGSAIGFIARDPIDGDFSWMVQREEGGSFRADDFQVSCETPDAAARDLMAAMLQPIDWSSVPDPDASGQPPSTGIETKKTSREMRSAEKRRSKSKRKSARAARKKGHKR
jgi:hypothetical protein